MQYRFFWIIAEAPAPAAGEAELNQILASHRIVGVEREFVAAGRHSAWSVCVSYQPADGGVATKSAKVDYREVLNEADFALFAKCRTLRKQLADAEGIPAYAIFTNQQLAQIVQQRVTTLAGLREIEGVGEAKASKYSAKFLPVLQSAATPAQLPQPGRIGAGLALA